MAAAFTPDGDGDRLRDLLAGGPELQRLLDVALEAALALGGEAGRDGDQLLGLAVEDRGPVGLLVELEVDLAEARVDHGVGPDLLRRLVRPPLSSSGKGTWRPLAAAVVVAGHRRRALLGRRDRRLFDFLSTLIGVSSSACHPDGWRGGGCSQQLRDRALVGRGSVAVRAAVAGAGHHEHVRLRSGRRLRARTRSPTACAGRRSCRRRGGPRRQMRGRACGCRPYRDRSRPGGRSSTATSFATGQFGTMRSHHRNPRKSVR